MITIFELFNGSSITSTLLTDIKKGVNKWNDLMLAIVNNDYNKFKKLISVIGVIRG